MEDLIVGLRPGNIDDFCAQISRQYELSISNREGGCALARRIHHIEGSRLDYQPGSLAPRPSFGASLKGLTGSLLSFGYGAHQEKPHVAILPRSGSGSTLPRWAHRAFRAALGQYGASYYPNERTSIEDLDDRDIEVLVAAVAAVAAQTTINVEDDSPADRGA